MEEYHRYRRRKILFVILLSLAAVVTIGLSLTIGGRNLGFFETYQVLFSHIMGATYDPASDQWLDDYIVWNSRLPRAIFAVLAGATLAVCGAVMQGVLHNPLADSYTTGVSSGACFGVSVSVVLGLSVGGGGDIYSLGTLLNAFIFALIPIAFIVGLSPLLKKSSASLILAGIAVSYLFNAFNTLLLVLTDAESLADIYIWQVGSVSEIFWADLPLVVAVCIPCMICMALLSGKLNILNTGDDDARALGLNVDNLKTVTLSFSALAVAVVVCKAGILSFVGLICPHIIRMFIDADNRFVIPASAGLAGVLLLGAEMISRTISPSGTIPVGVVLSFIGAPVLLYLIVRRRSNIY
jgi:iron complex transport system permease protein